MAQLTRDRGAGGAARIDPFAEFERLQSELGRFLGDGELTQVLREGFTPLADVEETDDAYLIEVELPGVRKEDIDISLTGRRLTVSGERKETERKGILRRQTRTVGRFYLEVVLPSDVNENEVSARLEEGVLVIRVPKTDNSQPRHIKVS